ncbi:hypothetical protein Cadr_000027459 [Camelus dromedarius]|uniref:Uncharacterized protein n=1 Tax=Camelus dromedarius TaxID=9838 RepID=A0A5N4CCC7_CAMDR|nr:hypothetical protein Cadr_000027459 [Camelus dromedarius]
MPHLAKTCSILVELPCWSHAGHLSPWRRGCRLPRASSWTSDGRRRPGTLPQTRICEACLPGEFPLTEKHRCTSSRLRCDVREWTCSAEFEHLVLTASGSTVSLLQVLCPSPSLPKVFFPLDQLGTWASLEQAFSARAPDRAGLRGAAGDLSGPDAAAGGSVAARYGWAGRGPGSGGATSQAQKGNRTRGWSLGQPCSLNSPDAPLRRCGGTRAAGGGIRNDAKGSRQEEHRGKPRRMDAAGRMYRAQQSWDLVSIRPPLGPGPDDDSFWAEASDMVKVRLFLRKPGEGRTGHTGSGRGAGVAHSLSAPAAAWFPSKERLQLSKCTSICELKPLLERARRRHRLPQNCPHSSLCPPRRRGVQPKTHRSSL